MNVPCAMFACVDSIKKKKMNTRGASSRLREVHLKESDAIEYTSIGNGR